MNEWQFMTRTSQGSMKFSASEENSREALQGLLVNSQTRYCKTCFWLWLPENPADPFDGHPGPDGCDFADIVRFKDLRGNQ